MNALAVSRLKGTDRTGALVVLGCCLLILFSVAGCVASLDSSPTNPQTVGVPAGHSPQIPSAIRARYPADRYLLGIGRAESPQVAIELARADLAKQIQVTIATLTTDYVRERDGATDQEFSRLVMAKTEQLLAGVETAAEGRSDDTGLSFAVLVLPKGEVEHLASSMQGLDVGQSLPLTTWQDAEPVWVTAEGVVPFGSDTTIAEAAARSRDLARRQAVEQAVGVFVNARTVIYNNQVAEEVIRSGVQGVIVEEEVIEEGVRVIDDEPNGRALLYATKLRAKVRPAPLQTGDSIKITASLNRSVFQDGEELRVRVLPSHDAYIYILSVGQDDQVRVLFPNRFAQNNFVTAQEEMLFPTDHQRAIGVRLRVVVPVGERKSLENIKVVASSKPLDVLVGQVAPRGSSPKSDHEEFMVTDLMRELTLLEDTRWSETTVPYEVRR